MDVYSNSNLTFYLNRLDDCITYPSVVGVAGGIFEVEKKLLLHSYLHAFTSNILSAALRIMPIGQTEIQKIIFQMKGNVEEMTNKSNGRRTIPQIFFDEMHIGGYQELRQLEKENKLLDLLK